MENKNYLILLYYCYAEIEDPDAYREEHHLFCVENNIRGRIIISTEGLNGTVSGLREDCSKYMDYVKSDPRFAKTEFKVDHYHKHAFSKINVRFKEEIVHANLKNINPNIRTGVHLAPLEFKELKDREDVVLLDVRSNYEHELGRFKNALTLDIENFRDFSGKVKELEHLKNRKIVTYCTGGIKCEKASAYLLEQGFKNVYQLHGGIIKYGLEAGGEDFEGNPDRIPKFAKVHTVHKHAPCIIKDSGHQVVVNKVTGLELKVGQIGLVINPDLRNVLIVRQTVHFFIIETTYDIHTS